jgi:hypothetical protein
MINDNRNAQNNRNLVFDIVRGLVIITVIGATLGALYEAPWNLFIKIIIFGLIFILGLIANEIARVANINMKTLDSLLLIFIQLNLMGEKNGVKQDKASKTLETLEDAELANMKTTRKMFGDFELMYIGFTIVLILVVAYVTTLFI